MRGALGLMVLVGLFGCRYLSAPTPQVSPARPGLLSAGNGSDPTRQPDDLPERRCVIGCGPGMHCDEKLAECVVDHGRSDAGVSWLP